jgi:Mn2+/Fe2+ NRAMP family transporter
VHQLFQTLRHIPDPADEDLCSCFWTISPYLFFWQAGQEVEELHRRHVKALCIAPRDAGPELSRIRTDTFVGMGFSHLVALFIIFATAAT